MNVLSVSDVSKSYNMGQNNRQMVLKNINLEIREGEFVSIMGPSGSGKSTLLYNISGMDKPDLGKIDFAGRDLMKEKEEELSKLRLIKMGFIFQQSNLLKNLNLFDNIILSAYLAKGETRASVNARALDLMQKMGVSELKDNDITQASGGQLQRVAICRALINQPDIIFGDEPTGALNSTATQEVMKILADIHNTGTTVLLATHDIKVAAKTERVIFMLDGSIVAEKRLPRYDETVDLKAREEELTDWLMELGF